MVNTITMSSEDYKSAGSSIKILYGGHNSPVGDCLIGVTGKESAVCFLWFIDDNNFEKGLEKLQQEWPGAKLVEDQSRIEKIAHRIFAHGEEENLTVLLRGTDFQVKVWKALTKIPRGEVSTYSQIAEEIGSKAVRAAGTAMKANRVAFLVPCHRVTNKAGENKYRWGPERRKAIMDWEKIGKA